MKIDGLTRELATRKPERIQKRVPIFLQRLQNMADQCLNATETTKSQFDNWAKRVELLKTACFESHGTNSQYILNLV